MWQKARFIEVAGMGENPAYYRRADLVGRTIWLEVAPPSTRASVARTFLSNLTHAKVKGRCLCVNTRGVELLPDFSADVPLMTFEEWLAQPRQGPQGDVK